MSLNRRLQILGVIVLILLVAWAISIARDKQKHKPPNPPSSPAVTATTGGPTI